MTLYSLLSRRAFLAALAAGTAECMTPCSREKGAWAVAFQPGRQKPSTSSRLALIGCGTRGIELARRADRCSEDRGASSIVAACDVLPERMEYWSRRPGISLYEDWRRCLEEVRPKGVVVALPPEACPAVVVAAAMRGIPVLWDCRPLPENLGVLLRYPLDTGDLCHVAPLFPEGMYQLPTAVRQKIGPVRACISASRIRSCNSLSSEHFCHLMALFYALNPGTPVSVEHLGGNAGAPDTMISSIRFADGARIEVTTTRMPLASPETVFHGVHGRLAIGEYHALGCGKPMRPQKSQITRRVDYWGNHLTMPDGTPSVEDLLLACAGIVGTERDIT